MAWKRSEERRVGKECRSTLFPYTTLFRSAKKKDKKAEEKKRAEDKRTQKAEDEKKASMKEDENTVIVTASSIEELLQKINDTIFMQRSDSVRTPQELQYGQSFDFSI